MPSCCTTAYSISDVIASAPRWRHPVIRRRELITLIGGAALYGLASDTLRLVRTAQVLEELGGDDARSLLERIETFGGRPAETAKAALGRMRK